MIFHTFDISFGNGNIKDPIRTSILYNKIDVFNKYLYQELVKFE